MSLDEVRRRYAVAVTPAMRALIDPANPSDPIARQFLPDVAELTEMAGERADPIGDKAHSPVAGIVHRHPGRVLLKIVTRCPVYCRFCFRREMIGPGKEAPLSADQLERALGYIAEHTEIGEVIFTGGDPLILPPRRIAALTARLAALRHVTVLRWHSRVPVVDPGRITADLVAALKAPGIAPWLAVHANHPREFTPQARHAIARLVDGGIALVSQSVLLKGVNADAGTLAELMQAFIENRIKPYYLHHPDLAPGTGHFRMSIAEGLALMAELRAQVSGLAMPNYMLDLPGGFGKVPLESHHVETCGDGYRIRDGHGRWHIYPPPAVMSAAQDAGPTDA